MRFRTTVTLVALFIVTAFVACLSVAISPETRPQSKEDLKLAHTPPSIIEPTTEPTLLLT